MTSVVARIRAGSLALLALVPFAVAGCRGCAREEPRPAAVDPLAGLDVAPYLATARAILTHATPPAAPAARAGQRVFVIAWRPGNGLPAARATGLGATLLESVIAASKEVALEVGGDAHGLRVELDVVTSSEASAFEARMPERVFDVGLDGYLAEDRAAGRLGWILPAEIVDGHLVDLAEKNWSVHLRGDEITAVIAARAHVSPGEVGAMRVSRIGVAAWIEPAAVGAPIRLFRHMPPPPHDLGPAALVAAVRAGADYLARMTEENGKLTYLYDPVTDEPMRGYDYLRHAGSIYALMEAYEELRVPEWRAAAERAIGYLIAHFETTPDGSGRYFFENSLEEQQKAGADGLSLVALAKYVEVTGDARELETMRALGRFLLHQQYPDGHFRDNADVTREDESARGEKRKKEISYFAGEAVLGLTRLYGIDPRPEWLAAARKGADFLVHVRDARDDLKHQIHDHWQSYALHDLFVLTRDPAYAAHAEKIARAILLGEKTGADVPYPDFVGTFYDEGETTPTSIRLEALASTMQLSRFAGKDDAWIAPAAMRLACMMRGQQLDAESDFFAKDPARAIGGVREGLERQDVRVDYVQHAMSGWLRLARLLRDPKYGTTAR